MLLFAKLFGKSDFDSALANLCIVAFWGLARLLELTYSGNSGPLQYDSSILTTEFLYHSLQRYHLGSNVWERY
ncbi:hypothetical protein PGTUg99_037641 [Puccinia graminis f. sp. tritici]|uniref:Uncharacterized protein n=1 Tax=Puccinia graminis f. sp. tritici TaxID=56615 RepID=A0A5B0SQ39_PUCGR|nr:hypothetical protein PGTUg99_037641 [Puccinia graminis f. sp. tritici]